MNKVSMELTPFMQPRIISLLDCQIEMLQGMKTKLPDGTTRFEFELPDHKFDILKEFLQHLMAIPHSDITVTMCGYKFIAN